MDGEAKAAQDEDDEQYEQDYSHRVPSFADTGAYTRAAMAKHQRLPRPLVWRLDLAESAFLLCGFWMARAASVCGDQVAAAHWSERSRSACGPAGPYSDEYDLHQRQQRGNLPQAFVHAGMLRTAVRLSRQPQSAVAGLADR